MSMTSEKVDMGIDMSVFHGPYLPRETSAKYSADRLLQQCLHQLNGHHIAVANASMDGFISERDACGRIREIGNESTRLLADIVMQGSFEE